MHKIFKNNLQSRTKILLEGQRRFDFLKPLKVIVNKYNHKICSKNLAIYPQLAIFAFDHIGVTINIEGRYENESLLLIKKFLENLKYNFSNKVALDIGANIGNHSIFFSELFKYVYAFEPNPHTYELLKINSIFACAKRNIKIRKYGLSNKNKKFAFNIDKKNIGASAIIDNSKIPSEKNIQITVKKLDSIKEIRNKNISLIKVDVEGHELEVLLGAKKLLRKNCPIVLFEQHRNEFKLKTSPTIDFLKSLNYNFCTIEKNFYFGESYLQKTFSLFCQMILGSQFRITERVNFESKFYDMIIAFPKK